MREQVKIYTINMMTKLEKDENGFPYCGSERVVGYYSVKEGAIQAVKENWCDICECCYNCAVVEEIEEGLYRPALNGNRWWFKYNDVTKMYDEIPEPEFCKGFSGFAIG